MVIKNGIKYVEINSNFKKTRLDPSNDLLVLP